MGNAHTRIRLLQQYEVGMLARGWAVTFHTVREAWLAHGGMPPRPYS